MLRIQLDDEVMKCFEDAAGVLKSKPGAPIDRAALTSILMEVGEAICLQLEKNRKDLLASYARLQRILEAQNCIGPPRPSADREVPTPGGHIV